MALDGPSEIMDLLNLGAGQRIIHSDETRRVVNHDRVRHSEAIDIAWDLNELPWPWPDERFDAIIAWAVLEHLAPDLMTTINECWRIMRTGGRLSVKLPYWNHERTWNDPTHRWPVGLGVFDQFDPSTDRGARYGFYTPRKWRIVAPAELTAEGASVYCQLIKRAGVVVQ